MENTEERKIYVHGHRGCRGLLPENTTAAFAYACELGVDYIELDVVLTANGDILVSHDPYMIHEICSHQDGTPVNLSEEKNLNIWKMTTEQAQTYVTGDFPHPRFPDQKLVRRSKPTLAHTVQYIQEFCNDNLLNSPHWNIEIKSQPEWDNVYHPSPATYVSSFLKQFKSMSIDNRSVIQSFDKRILEEVHLQAPELKLVYLSEVPNCTAEKMIQDLSFKPYGISPHFQLVDRSMVEWCQANSVELIVWTVNEENDIKRMIEIGVKHIISDYPDRVIRLINERK